MSPGSCVGECSSTFEILLHQGVHAHGSLRAQVPVLNSTWVSAVLSVLQRSITLLLRFAWSPNLPSRELRLRRLFSSIVYLSSIYEDCKYRVLQPFGSWDMFIIPVMILILIGMLSLFTVSGKGAPLRSTQLRDAAGRFTRSRTMRSRITQRSPASTLVSTPF